MQNGSNSKLEWRHAHFFIITPHETDQIALIGFLGNNRRLVKFAGTRSRRSHVQSETRLLLICAMTVIALRLEDRSDIAHEID